ncbi:methyl-accepting chemotaxis protein [Aliamphritea spongicola]|uniref:methyl-accepting chemotaxis protein n=1 Tax=Aliamphritea spongicola TaxID=707589 RepID=UPI00196B1DF6|nr:HAMP domain-containing methyl-accepting chemotaxis protein [Aliamphritea spongicola]MBN3563707.1 methyl-accepting chemotaxis protein [Aliamphritea spongicola]
MISRLRRFKVTTRILGLVCFLILVMVAEMGFLLSEMQQLRQGSQQQQTTVSEQNRWLDHQATQIQLQTVNQQRLLQAQQVQKTFSDMIFWYFDGTVTQYYESLNNATGAADLLESQLRALNATPDAAGITGQLLENLMAYRTLMNNAGNYYQQGKNNLAGVEIGDANILANTINEQLLTLTNLFQTKLSEASSEVQQSLENTLIASTQVAAVSQSSQQLIATTQTTTLLMLLASLPVTFGVAILIILSITRPLKSLQQQLLTIETESDLTRPLSLDGRDEIQAMSAATQKLLDKLRTTMDEIDSVSHELQSTADEGYRLSVKTHRQSIEQQQRSETIAAAATQLGASAEDISRTTAQGLHQVNDVSGAAIAGQQDVKSTAKTIQDLARQFDQVEDSVNTLVQHSASIGDVLDVIRGIAEQTNLLALNAAIEAARAGDQGRGFAVVADEVRTLAQRTSHSTNEIQAMVEALQGQSRVAMTSLEQNRTQVDAGVQLSQQAEASLTVILDSLQALSEMNQSIAAITGEQQHAALGVDESVQSVREMASQVESQAAGSRQVNQTLNTLADTLKQTLTAFRH